MTKIKKQKKHEAMNATSPHENLFSRFMNQVTGSSSREMETARNTASTHEHKETAAPEDNGDLKITAEAKVRHGTSTIISPDGLTVVKYSSLEKVEDTAPEQEQDDQGGRAPNTGNADPDEGIYTKTQLVDGDMAPVCSPVQAPNKSDNTVQSNENTRTLGASLDQEGQNATNDDKNTDDMASRKAIGVAKYDEMQEVKPPVSSLDVESAEKIDKQGRKEHSSEKKRKEKRPHKRSKSGDHYAESSKRAKTMEASVLNGEVENTKVSGPGNHAEAKGVEQARARIPTNCSIRHEYDQEQELKDGKKLAKSRRYTKFMRTTLEDHQLTALSWMVKREKEFPRPAAGGIIGDEMGLGKTVTSLACIVTNRLNKSERTNRAEATLVLVPNRKNALQWRDEARVSVGVCVYPLTLLCFPQSCFSKR
jgi:hypothetical protein